MDAQIEQRVIIKFLWYERCITDNIQETLWRVYEETWYANSIVLADDYMTESVSRKIESEKHMLIICVVPADNSLSSNSQLKCHSIADTFVMLLLSNS
jgi:hypothetical protein